LILKATANPIYDLGQGADGAVVVLITQGYNAVVRTQPFPTIEGNPVKREINMPAYTSISLVCWGTYWNVVSKDPLVIVQ